MKAQKTEICVNFDVVLVCAECRKTDTGEMADLFRTLSLSGTNIDLISLIPPRRSAGSLSFSVYSCDFAKVLRAAAQLKDAPSAMRLEVNGGYSKITLRGTHFSRETGIVADFFSALYAAGSETALITASDKSISVLVGTDELDKTVAAIEEAFPDATVIYQEEI